MNNLLALWILVTANTQPVQPMRTTEGNFRVYTEYAECAREAAIFQLRGYAVQCVPLNTLFEVK